MPRKLCVILFVWAGFVACDAPGAPSGPDPQDIPDEVSVVAALPEPIAVEADAAELAEVAPYKIVMLGDSLTAGFQLPADKALPDQVHARLMAAGRSVEMVNAGVSGDTSAGGLARYEWSVGELEPDLLIVALGANDFLQNLDPVRLRDNLAEIIERAQADEVTVILASVSPRSTAENDPRAAEFAAIYPALAEQYGVAHFEGLLEGVRDRPDLLLSDGLHPTADGVGIIADRLVPVIEAVLEDAA